MKQNLSIARQIELLKMEYECEKKTFQRDTELMGVDRKVKRGDCWFPVSTGRGYYNSLDRFVVEIMRTPDSDIDHNFEYGRPVCFFRKMGQDFCTTFHFKAQ